MKRTDVWKVLYRKAAEDLYTVEKLIAFSDSPSEVIGFHLQQAAEKLLKSLLCHRKIQYRPRHDLGVLILLVRKAGLAFPKELVSIKNLTPFAAEWRYNFLPMERAGKFDRAGTHALVLALRKWIEQQLPPVTKG